MRAEGEPKCLEEAESPDAVVGVVEFDMERESLVELLLERRFHNGLLDSIGKLGRDITRCAGTSLYGEGRANDGWRKAKMSGKRAKQ